MLYHFRKRSDNLVTADVKIKCIIILINICDQDKSLNADD